MHIAKVVIKHYRCLINSTVDLNPNLNVIVGDNECGKSTLLEAIHLALSGQINGRAIQGELHPYLFNSRVVSQYIAALHKKYVGPPPPILIELYFSDDPALTKLKGRINSLKLDVPGVRMLIEFNEGYRAEYEDYIADPSLIRTVPVEHYIVRWRDFADNDVTARSIPVRPSYIDASTLRNNGVANRYVLDVVKDSLTREEQVSLALSYRQMKDRFLADPKVAAINSGLETKKGHVSDKAITVSLDSSARASWESGVMPHLDDIPMTLVGKGEQSAVKIKLALDVADGSHVFLIEEAENHLSFTNLASLIAHITAKRGDRQLLITTHSSYVINKLGVDSVLMFMNGIATKLTALDPTTRDYFLKLPGWPDRAIERDLQSWFSSLPKAHPSKKWSRYKRVDKNGPWRDRDISWPGGGGPRYDVPHPETKLPCKVPERGWIYSDPAEMQRQIKLGLVEFRADHLEPPFRKAHIRPIPEEDEIELDLEGVAEDVDNESEEEFANQVRGSYFYKQSQVSVKALRQLMGAKVFNNPKDFEEIARLIEYTTQNDPDAIVLDFFAGSGTTGQAVWSLNVRDGGNRRFILVQLPERLDPSKKDQKAAASYCDKLEKPRTIAELTKERLRRAGQKFKDDTSVEGDLGFRVFKLSRSNIRAWEPISSDLEGTLLANAEHIVPGRTEQDILYELLLKLGLDLCVSIETQQIAGKSVHAIGGGALMVCLADGLTKDVVEILSAGIVAWWKHLAPAVDTRTVFKDSGFADDVAKTNMAAILNQNGILDVRSL